MWILFSFSWLVFLKVRPLFLSLAPKNQLLSWLIFSVLLKLQISLISYFILHKFSLQFLCLLYLFYANTIIHSVAPYTNLKLSLTPHDPSTCIFYLICISKLCCLTFQKELYKCWLFTLTSPFLIYSINFSSTCKASPGI